MFSTIHPSSPSAAEETSSTRVWIKKSVLEKAIKTTTATTKGRPPTAVRTISNNDPLSSSLNSLNNSKRFSRSQSLPFQQKPSNNQLLSHSQHSFSSSGYTADLTESSTDSDFSSATGNTMQRVLQWSWTEGVLQEQDDKKIVVKSSSDGALHTLPSTALQEGNVVLSNDYENSMPPSDLITLTHLHEPAVVDSLLLRYQQDKIYTATGPVLLALNPFQTVRGMYGDAVQRKYVEAAENHVTLEPHVYAIADTSFRSMMRALEDSLDRIGADNHDSDDDSSNKIKSEQINQSILVSGESGSGKTVTTKFVMKYLAALSQRSVQLQTKEERAYLKAQHKEKQQQQQRSNNWKRQNSMDSNAQNSNNFSVAGNSIEARVLQSNPILESFGNARTVRNDNSSRFGKFIEIQFTETGKLVGAQIETYLLEKVRLVQQSAGERNYHIFYELLSGCLNQRELSEYFLAPTAAPEDFKMTCSGTNTRRDGVSDRETCKELLVAMTTMCFSKEDIFHVFSVASAILHASNLTFTATDSESCSIDKTNVHLRPVCELLGVSLEDLNQALCHCSIQAGAQTVLRSLNAEQAANGLEALLKETYGALFQYLQRCINSQIAHKPEDEEGRVTRPAATIGVLDIFGFESFATNSFEQLCINYCNEALQQQFNAFVLENEQAEYEREGIEWSFIEFPENQDVLDLMEKRGASILSILDDQCRAPGPSDKAFCLAVYAQCGRLPRFEASRKQQAMLQFSVHHYAGPVEYTVAGFTAKNKDELPKETVLLLSSSETPFVRGLAALMEESHRAPPSTEATPRKQLRRADSSVGRATVGGQFRHQLKSLRQKIDRTAPHYIRCLKPNDMLVPDHFDTAIVAEQLRCGGILEAVRVARAGFTQHYTHADFVRRYRSLAWKELAKQSSSTAPQSPSWNQPARTTPVRSNSFRNSYPIMPSYVPKASNKKDEKEKQAKKTELSAGEAKALCKNLIKELYRKIQQQGITIDGGPQPEEIPVATPPAKAKTYNAPSSTNLPSWSRRNSTPVAPVVDARTPPQRPPSGVGSVKSRWQNRASLQPSPIVTSPVPQSPSPSKPWRRSSLTGSDFAKIGVQMGKTKVFLRHSAFEALERIRSMEQTNAATKLNSLFRRYLARIAFVPYLNAYRKAKNRGMDLFDDTFKEHKEGDNENSFSASSMNKSFHSARSSYSYGSSCFASESLVDKWTEAQIRDAIHNPIPRNEWGKQAIDSDKFKWVLREGLWVKNYE